MANKRLVTEIGETCIKVSEGEISINSPSSRVGSCLLLPLRLSFARARVRLLSRRKEEATVLSSSREPSLRSLALAPVHS